MAMSPEVTAAFQCMTGISEGEPHAFEYRNRPNGTYLCRKCLASFTKQRLKELTDA